VPNTWNPGDRDLGIGLSNGNLTATKTTTHATNWSGVRSVFWAPAGSSYWELKYNYTGTANIVTGICDADYPLSTRLGENWAPSVGCAGPDVNGDCWGTTGPVDPINIGAIASGTIVCCLFDWDSNSFYVRRLADPDFTLIKKGGIVDAVQRNFYIETALLRPTGSTVSVDANFGGSPFLGDLPPGAEPAAYFPAPIERTVYVGSDVFNT
jgi:hypothetical protein